LNDYTFAVVFVTVPSDEEAEAISTTLLEMKKVACINSIPEVNSLFRWQGKVEKEKERLLVMKTKMSLVGEVIDIVKEKHSYEVPEVIALPIIAGNAEYLSWLDEETSE
jgi:periplasmic divalent cation tolerance protein